MINRYLVIFDSSIAVWDVTIYNSC